MSRKFFCFFKNATEMLRSILISFPYAARVSIRKRGEQNQGRQTYIRRP